MKKPGNTIVTVIVLAVVAYLAYTFLMPYLQKNPIKPINSGGYREYNHAQESQTPKACASVKQVKKGITTHETCYDKNGKALYTKKIID